MKLKNQLVVALLGFGLAGSAAADEKKEMSKKDMAKGGVSCFVTTESITGKEVWDFHGNMIGSIDSVLVKPAGGRTLLVVDAEEWLDDDPKVAIPLQRFYVKKKDGDPDDLVYTLNTTKEELEGAPSYEDVTDPDAYNEAHVRSVYNYWKVKTKNAAKATGRAAEDAAEAVERATENAAEATADTVRDAADAIEEAVDSDSR